jgi:hypothetical protein
VSDNVHAPVAMMIADAYSKIKKLKQQLSERDALILELEKVREFYAHPVLGHKINELARTPLKNQKLLDEIKGRV